MSLIFDDHAGAILPIALYIVVRRVKRLVASYFLKAHEEVLKAINKSTVTSIDLW